MIGDWAREIWIFVGILAATLFVGLATGRPGSVLAIGLAVYLAVTLRHLHRLHRWLLSKKQGPIPEAGGVWGEVFDEIRKLERETQRRKGRLHGMLERFQSAAAAVPDAMVILSQEDEIEWANRAAESQLGVHWPRDQALRIVNLVRDPDFITYLQKGEYQESINMPSPVVSGNTLSVQIIPFGERQKLLIFRDVTHWARLEEMRRVFVANASHELRTPVTVLLGFLETLKDATKSPPPEELRGYFATMLDQAQRMQRLIDDLLALSKLETTPAHVKEEEIDVPAMLASLKEQGDLLSAGRHSIVVEADPALRLLGNREELGSAFSNLVTNAVRHTPEGGRILLHWFIDAEGAKLAVSDTGEGIAAHHLPYLTQRFYRVDSGRSRASGGTGLGLSIVKHILMRHEARLVIESQLGQGSTFTCVFPAARIRSQSARLGSA